VLAAIGHQIWTSHPGKPGKPPSNLDTGSLLLVLRGKGSVEVEREPQPPKTVSHPGLPEGPRQGPGSDRPLVGYLEPRTRLGPALAAHSRHGLMGYSAPGPLATLAAAAVR
jgi:hypothetical protein